MADYVTTTFMRYFNTKRNYDTTSQPTLAQITSIIPTVTGEINARLGAVGITVPITTSPTHQAYLYVKRLAGLKVACIAENAAFMGGHQQESPHAEVYCKEYEAKMAAIEMNPSILNNLINGTTGASLDSYEYSNADKRRDAEPFNRGEDDW